MSLFDPIREKVTYMTTKQKMCDAFKAANTWWAKKGRYSAYTHNCQTWANKMKAEVKKTRTPVTSKEGEELEVTELEVKKPRTPTAWE